MKATKQELIEALTSRYDYISKRDAIYFLVELFRHRGNRASDYIEAWKEAY